MPEEAFQVNFTPTFQRNRTQRQGGLKIEDADLWEAASYFWRGEPFPASWQDHALRGQWKGCREFHLQGAGDKLIIYRFHEKGVDFLAIGTHDQLYPPRRWPARPTKEARLLARQALQRKRETEKRHDE